MIQKTHQLPRTRRCELLDIPRSSSYYQPQPVSEEDQALMRLIDRIHLEKPYLSSRRIVDALEEAIFRYGQWTMLANQRRIRAEDQLVAKSKTALSPWHGSRYVFTIH